MTQRRTSSNGLLSLVATPIGNLEDITLRALRTLRECSMILAEDTRRTQQLLRAHAITHARVVRLDDHASEEKITALMRQLHDENSWYALVTDAGTPMVSDPGAAVVVAALAHGCEVEAVPGASAALAALQVSGLTQPGFRFVAFLPRDGVERASALAAIARDPLPTIFFESPHRVHKTLMDLSVVCGAERNASVSRELTKMYEQTMRGSLQSLIEQTSGELLGEFVVVVQGAQHSDSAGETTSEITVESALDAALKAGMKPSIAAREVAKALGLERGAVYQLAIERAQRER